MAQHRAKCHRAVGGPRSVASPYPRGRCSGPTVTRPTVRGRRLHACRRLWMPTMPPTSPTNAAGSRARGRPGSKAWSRAAVVGTQWWGRIKAALRSAVRRCAGPRRPRWVSACAPPRWTSKGWAPSVRPGPRWNATFLSTPASHAATSRSKSTGRSPTRYSGLSRRPIRHGGVTRRSPPRTAWWRRHWSSAGQSPDRPCKRLGSSTHVSSAVPTKSLRTWTFPRNGARLCDHWANLAPRFGHRTEAVERSARPCCGV